MRCTAPSRHSIVGGIGNFHKHPWAVLETNTALVNAVVGAALAVVCAVPSADV